MENNQEIFPLPEAEKKSQKPCLKTVFCASLAHYINNLATADLIEEHYQDPTKERAIQEQTKRIHWLTRPLIEIAHEEEKTAPKIKKSYSGEEFQFNPETANQVAEEILHQLGIPSEKGKAFETFYQRLEQEVAGLPRTQKTLARLKRIFLGQEEAKEVDHFRVILFKEEADKIKP